MVDPRADPPGQTAVHYDTNLDERFLVQNYKCLIVFLHLTNLII